MTFYNRIIKSWGISQAVADHFGLKLKNHAWLIYESGEGMRCRMLALHGKSRTGAKNIWDKDTAHLDRPALFNIQCLLHAEGEVWLTNGEKTSMAMMTAGILKVVNTFGEGNQVAEAITILKEYGIWTVHLVPDCDTHGIQAAWKWQQLGSEAGLDIRVYDLAAYALTHFGLSPDELAGWDLRDLWLYLKQDGTAFQTALQQLPKLDFNDYRQHLPDEASPPRRHRPPPLHRATATAGIGGLDWAAAYQQWQQAEVLASLTQVSPSNKGIHQHRHCPNPHHHDQHPSFRITEQGAPICTCGTVTWTALAEWVDAISWSEYKKLVIARQIKPPATPYHFPHGIPNDLRQTLLKLHQWGPFKDQVAALIVLELRQEAVEEGIIHPQDTLTVAQLLDYAQTQRGTTDYTLREGLNQATALGFFTRTDVPDGRGRPMGYYQPVPLQAALATLRQKIAYRLREQLYGDHTPDTITADFFPEYPEQQASHLAERENEQRVPLYRQFVHRRAELDNRYNEQVRRLEAHLSYDRLLQSSSSWLDPDAAWKNGSDYRRTFNFALTRYRIELGKSMTQVQRAALIGVSPKTMTTYQQQTGIILEPQFLETELQQPHFLTTLDHLAPWAKDRPYGRFLESSSGRRRAVRPDQLEALETWVAQQLATGQTVIAKVQIASLERWADEHERQQLNEHLTNQRLRTAASARQQASSSRDQPEFPNTLTADYRQQQLNMTHYDVAFLVDVQAILGDLFWNLPYGQAVIEDKVGKFRNKYVRAGVYPPSNAPPDAIVPA